MPIYPCDLCETTFTSKEFLAEHISTSHPADSVFRPPRHSQASHDPGLTCKICGIILIKSRENVNNMKFHIDNVHLDIKPYQCTMCDKSTT